jgi:ATP-dependent Clp protease ATP-binding subunit ClpA
MSPQFDDRAQKTFELAQSEARAMGHSYVGTEHLLLALMQVGFDAATHLLGRFHLTIDGLRSEIEKLVHRGDQPIQPGKLPLTPRANRAIEYAQTEAAALKLTSVGPEHLLLGLCREPDGVASQVLRNLGVQLENLRSEVFRIRLEQFKIVERAVRPVRAGTAWKRKTREELLAHLTAIYDEELEQSHDPNAAFKAAAERFGDPAELVQELAASLPAGERSGIWSNASSAGGPQKRPSNICCVRWSRCMRHLPSAAQSSRS